MRFHILQYEHSIKKKKSVAQALDPFIERGPESGDLEAFNTAFKGLLASFILI